jgi:hypothetical protein
MKIHVLVEGPSERVFLERWAPRFLKGHEVRAYPHQGKGTLPKKAAKPDARDRTLLGQLPSKLAAFGKSPSKDKECVLVLLDADNDNVTHLNRELRALVDRLSPAPEVAFAFAVEELEAFYLGDLSAMATAFPGFDRKLAGKYKPDSICGTWELFGRVIRDDGANKVSWATHMGAALTTRPSQSRSPSFKTLCGELQRLASSQGVSEKPNPKPRKAGAATARDAAGKRKR